jgi:hypothetical protein
MNVKPLPPGREFERKVFGFWGENSNQQLPKISYDAAIVDVVYSHRFIYDEEGNGETYDSEKPQGGLNKEIWSAVRRYLPEEVEGLPDGGLCYHIAIGMPLDRIYGVDAFFIWLGERVTIDASLRPQGQMGKRLKADFLLGPVDVSSPENIMNFGYRVAMLLIRRVNESTRQRQRPFNSIAAIPGLDM